MVRRLLIGVIAPLLAGVLFVYPLFALAQQTTLQVCVIAAPGDTCTNTGGGGGGGGSGGGGSGGSGGSGTTPPLAYDPTAGEVYFYGVAYPGSLVTLLKDGSLLTKTTAGPDAKFEFDVTNITPGTYTFGVWSQDARGVKSTTNSFSVLVASGVGTVISGIYLPPTIDTDKSQVRQGDTITILGSSAPYSQVNVFVHSSTEIIQNTNADRNGLWRYVLDTVPLEYGSHDSMARWKDTKGISPLSATTSFIVGSTNIFKDTASKASSGDIDGNGRVDAVDFSILAYWYKRPLTSLGTKADINHDGKVDARDFSILAYYWNG